MIEGGPNAKTDRELANEWREKHYELDAWATSELSRLLTENAALRLALEPFGRAWEIAQKNSIEGRVSLSQLAALAACEVTSVDFRRVASVLSGNKDLSMADYKQLYMNGRGIMERTRELNDALWAALPLAYIGACAMIIAPITAWAVWVHHFPWQPPPTPFDYGIAIALSLAGIVAGAFGLWPWLRASHAVEQHRLAMQRETKKRGKGWASS